ncbi:MAG: hypothetical protein WDN26_17715 [Chitinophagaceae bacterium]
MKYKIILLLLACAFVSHLPAQPPPAKTSIRIVDTLTAQEKNNRNRLILRSELDSMIRLHDSAMAQLQIQQPVKEPVKQESIPGYILIIGIIALLLIAGLLYLLFRNQKKFNYAITSLRKQMQQLQFSAQQMEESTPTSNNMKSKSSTSSQEKKIQSLSAQLEKAEKENQELEIVLNEYTKIKQEFEAIKQQMTHVYKIRNYPGYDKQKSETEIVKGMLETEKSVALYAYDHFLKPILSLVDANKNNPAKISSEDQQKLLELMISLSLLYSEYLYLRVNDLSIGGKMVERIGGLKNGNSVDAGLLKELNTEHGSRALVLRMVLDKTSIQHLSYPVFDETNLNLS